MSNLGPQQQNVSYDGLLQIPGGVTSDLQPVQDGMGNFTGLWLSSSGTNTPTSDTFIASNNGTAYTGAVPRLISDGFGDYLSVKDFGAVGDGVTDDTAAMLAAEASGSSVYWPIGNYVVTQSPTLGTSWGDGVVRVSGSIVYLHPLPGPVDCIYVEVFQPPAAGSGSSASTAIQNAINYAQAVRLPLLFPANGDYKISTTLTAKAGRDLSGHKYDVDINFNKSIFRPGPGVTAFLVNGVCEWVNVSSGRAECYINIKNLEVDGYFADSTSKGIVIGTSGYQIQGHSYGFIEYVVIKQNWPAGAIQFNIFNTQNIAFSRCVFAPVISSNNGQFTGDFQFYSCNFQQPASSAKSLSLTASSNSQIRGLKFIDCDVYGTNTEIHAEGYALVGDIWFYGCQWDSNDAATGTTVIDINAGSTGQNAQIFNITFDNTYIVGYSGRYISIVQNAGSAINAIKINGLYMNSADVTTTAYNCALYLYGVSSATICNMNANDITGTTGSTIISVINSQNVMISNNLCVYCPNMEYGVSIGGTSTRYSILGNQMHATVSIVNDYSSGTPIKQVANNLAV